MTKGILIKFKASVSRTAGISYPMSIDAVRNTCLSFLQCRDLYTKKLVSSGLGIITTEKQTTTVVLTPAVIS